MSATTEAAIDAALHLGLVWSVAHRLKRWASVYGVELDDLVGEGSIALVRAARVFKESRGPSFSSFAIPCIERHMVNHVKGLRCKKRLQEGKRESEFFFDAVGTEDPHSATEARLTVAGLMDCLKPRERQVVALHFGLDGGGERIGWEIAETLGVSRERVRQILAAALDKMRLHARIRSQLSQQGETFTAFGYGNPRSRCRTPIV